MILTYPFYLIYAPNVRAGGGLILLQVLLTAWKGYPRMHAILDQRARQALLIPAGLKVDWVAPGMLNRIQAELRLVDAARNGTRVLCFHGLPPLFVGHAFGQKLIVFLQNRLLLEDSSLRAYPLAVRLRLVCERWFLRWKIRSVGHVIVQGFSMKRALYALLGTAAEDRPQVHIRPLLPDDMVCAPSGSEEHAFDFIYPASGEAHKNHWRLIEAWELLAEDGHRPSLALTLGPQDGELWARLQERIDRAGLAITNLGTLSRRRLEDVYAAAGALIYPSTTESFGLPLGEAVRLGIPIVAGELDYVRDVCMPAQTFDPNSAVSIMRAVKRHLPVEEKQLKLETADAFWKSLPAATEGGS